MTNLLVSRISFGDNLINQQVTKPAQTVEKAKDNKLPDNAKIMIGLGALSTAILGGLLAHKCIKLNKLAKDNEQLNKLCSDYKNKFLDKLQFNVYCGSECKTAGKTIEESITSIYGKDCNIKPHTYDTSKEYLIETCENENGFFSRLIASNNKYSKRGLGTELTLKDIKWESIKQGRPVKGEISILEGTNEYGQKCVKISFPSFETTSTGDFIPNDIMIFSRNGEYTPLQKDLLKLKDKAFTETEKEMLKELTLTTHVGEKHGFQGNFDAILSVIQHLANG